MHLSTHTYTYPLYDGGSGKDNYNKNSHSEEERMGNSHRSTEIMKSCWVEIVKDPHFNNGVNF